MKKSKVKLLFSVKVGLTLCQIMAQLKVSEGAVHLNLKSFSETRSLARKDPPSEDQYINSSSLRDGKTASSSTGS